LLNFRKEAPIPNLLDKNYISSRKEEVRGRLEFLYEMVEASTASMAPTV
jgi:hypothetical protein